VPTPPDASTLAEVLAKAPFTLAMSSGFFGFFAHAGMVTALHERDLIPARIVGSSAGALIGACWAAGRHPQHIKSALLALRRQDFWDPRPGLGLLGGRRFAKLLHGLLPVHTFAHCPIPLAVSVFDGLRLATRVIDHGPLVPAVVASCAVPGLFQPVWINRRPMWDGGILDRRAQAPLKTDERVFYHHLASKSPWRRASSPALQLPQRPNLWSLVIPDLPRVGPHRLELGAQAYQMAYDKTRRALDLPPQCH